MATAKQSSKTLRTTEATWPRDEGEGQENFSDKYRMKLYSVIL